MANIGAILATSFKYIYSKLCRCTHPPDLPKKATLPSSKSDTTSFLDEVEDIVSHSSASKASYDESISGGLGSRKTTLKAPAMRNIVELAKKKNSVMINSEAQIVTAVSNEAAMKNINNNNNPSDESKDVPKKGLMGRLSSKLSKVSEAPELPKEEEVIKFKLVEDIRLVTIPITSCLLVLLGYLVFGAILFAHWEVSRERYSRITFYGDIFQDWSYLDGVYFCFISLMTIGFGDFVPGKAYIYNFDETIPESEANAKLVLGAIYILLGMGIIAMCVNLMQEKIITEVSFMFRKAFKK